MSDNARINTYRQRVSEREVKLLLSGYRGFAFVIGAVQFAFHPSFLQTLNEYILLAFVGAYTAAKVVLPFNWYRRDVVTQSIVAIDLVFCAVLPAVTGGLGSGFLLYSLCPLLTIALISSRRITFAAAALLAASTLGGQFFATDPALRVTAFADPYSLSLTAVYLILCVLCAWLPHVTNVNVSAGIRHAAVLEERRRLSREIHDNLAQTLSGINWDADILCQVVSSGDMDKVRSQAMEIREAVQAVQREVRENIDFLRRDNLETLGLANLLVDHARQLARASGLRCEVHVADGHVPLPRLAEVELLCIAQEALSNVKKHACAKNVKVSLASSTEQVEMVIKDDGAGFDPEGRKSRRFTSIRSHGLQVMAERAASIGGTLAIAAEMGAGTEVRVVVPSKSLKRLR